MMLYQAIPDFLDRSSCAALLDYAIANESLFTPTTVDSDDQPKLSVRRSRRLLDLGGFGKLIEQRAAHFAAGLVRDLRLTPFEATSFEVELVAHEHEAFYKRHIDLVTGPAIRRKGGDRLLSVVLYLNQEPKRFSGGELRLYPNPNPAESQHDAVEIVPDHGLAVAFSSWISHEVRPVRCPSQQFGDSRFAINCWVLRDVPGASAERE
jgi:Rps23 Pro-64 3,4-dihydroxylase Tpa1-like proline 4-hydroxylase